MATSDPQYYNYCRSEIFPLLPERIGRLLEIGCGAGGTAELIRARYAPEWMGGVELNAAAAARAGQHFDSVWQLDVERAALPVPEGSLDVILCLDVLEHLVDPWSTVDRLSALLKPGGCIIASIPNIRHYKVLAGLLFRGAFDYQDAGILDRTHLRFFVRRTAVALLSRAGLVVERVEITGLKPRKLKWWLNRLLAGRLEDLLALQYLLRAVKGPGPGTP